MYFRLINPISKPKHNLTLEKHNRQVIYNKLLQKWQKPFNM